MSTKLEMRDAEFIRLFKEFGEWTPPQIARAYDVHPDTVRNILYGKSFKPEGHRKDGHRQQRKLTDEQVRTIRELSAAGHKNCISRHLGKKVSRATVRQVVLRHTYQDIE